MAHFLRAKGYKVVRDFVRMVAAKLRISLRFAGSGTSKIPIANRVEERPGGMLAPCGVSDMVVRVDERYYRPTEVEKLQGDPTKAKKELGWTTTTSLAKFVSETVESDLPFARGDHLTISSGCRTPRQDAE